MFLENSTNLYNNLIVENQGTGLRIKVAQMSPQGLPQRIRFCSTEEMELI